MRSEGTWIASEEGWGLQLAEKPEIEPALYQGTASAVPKKLKKKRGL